MCNRILYNDIVLINRKTSSREKMSFLLYLSLYRCICMCLHCDMDVAFPPVMTVFHSGHTA